MINSLQHHQPRPAMPLSCALPPSFDRLLAYSRSQATRIARVMACTAIVLHSTLFPFSVEQAGSRDKVGMHLNNANKQCSVYIPTLGLYWMASAI
nr:hypothetical protein [Ktedonobacteraceae bacterium]